MQRPTFMMVAPTTRRARLVIQEAPNGWEVPPNLRRTPAPEDDVASYILSLPDRAAVERERLANEAEGTARDARLRTLLAKACRVLEMDLPYPARTVDHRAWLERLGLYLDVTTCQLAANTHRGVLIMVDPYPSDVWLLVARLHGPCGLLAEALRVRSAADLAGLFRQAVAP